MKYLMLLSCGLLLTMQVLFGQEARVSLSLKDAQEYAIEHNKELMNAREDIELAKLKYNEARSQGLPQVNGSMDYMTNFNYEFEFSAGAGTSEPPDIDYSLLDAGDYEVLSAINSMFSGGASTIVMEDQANASVQLSQLVFSGQYWIGLEMSKIAEDLSRKQYLTSELDIKQSVANTYYLVQVTKNNLHILEKNIENMLTVKKHTSDMVRVGMAEQTDLDQIRINVSQLENTLQSAKRNLQLSYNMLRMQLGISDTVEIALEESLDDVLAPITNSDLQSNEFSPDMNATYQMVELQTKVQKKQVKMEKWAYAPVVTGFYSYTEKILRSGFDLSPNHAAGLTLSLPIFSGGQRQSKLNQAKIELEKAQRSKSYLEDQLQLQANQLHYDFISAMENYKTQKENVKVARNLYDNIANKYRQGLVSSLDLTQANSNYLQAENNYNSAALKLLQSKLALERLYNLL